MPMGSSADLDATVLWDDRIMATLEQVVRFLRSHPGAHKARTIALSLGSKVGDINSTLYRGLGQFFAKNADFEWYLLSDASAAATPFSDTPPTEPTAPSKPPSTSLYPATPVVSAPISLVGANSMPEQREPTIVPPPVHDPERQRALAVFRYLRDLAHLRTAVVRDLRTYERYFWLDAVRGKAGCTARCFRGDPGANWLGAETPEDDLWLSVKKLSEPSLPPLPTSIKDWVVPDSGKHSDSPPRLLDRIERQQPGARSGRDSPNEPTSEKGQSPPAGGGAPHTPAGEQYELLEDHPEVAVTLNDYMQASWKPWAEKHAAWLDFQEKVYAPLFVIHRDLQRLGEEFELVLGLGCLTWTTPNGQQVRRHLIAAQVALEFDPAGGVFTLRPGSDGAKLALEIDMLDPTEQPTVPQRDVVSADLAKADDDPWDFEAIDRALRGFAQAIQADATYDPASYEPKGIDRVPQAAFAPALLLRRRTSKGLLLAFDEIIKQLHEGEVIPPGVKRLTQAATSESQGETQQGSLKFADTRTSTRVYFPLPANEDQRQIVERLDGRHGVLVQGPPGTGKSHTIANLICHLLATGQRVLITAQTPRALQVLRDKLPQEIRPLCLSVLGNDKAAQDNVEDSVRNITDKADSWNSGAANDEIRKAETELDRLAHRETTLEREVRTFREAEIHEHTIAGGAYSGTAQAIAQKVRRDAQRFAWFTDTAEPDAVPPVDAAALSAYRDGMIRVTPQRLAEMEQRRPVRGSEIPTDDTLTTLIHTSRTLRDRIRPVADGEVRLGTLPLDELRAAAFALRVLQAAVQQVPTAATPWAAVALSDVLRGVSATWDLLLAQTSAAVAAHHDLAAKLDKTDIRLPSGRRSDVLLADVADLLGHLQRGGGLGFLVFRSKVVRRTIYLCREATIDGRPCDNAGALSTAKHQLECSAAVAKVWTLWDGKAAPSTKTNGQQIGELRELCAILTRVLAVRPLADAASAALAHLHISDGPVLHDLRAVDEFSARCERVIVRREYDVVTSQLDARVQALRVVAASPNAHPVCARLADAIEQQDERGVTAALAEVAGLESDAARLAEWSQLDERITAVLPKLARAIAESHADPIWKARIADCKAAWNWAQADAWLAKYTDPRKAAAVESELRQVKDRIKTYLVRASAERAWHSCLSAMSAAHQQHLNAWRQAIKKIGKGTGKHAGHWRRVAQGELEQCRNAIPAWVMPLYRVFESVKPAPGIFDVVIVDEASQCGPESLILFYLAKKIIVVGDDKQISPSNVGIDKNQAKQLLTQHLAGIPFAASFDIDSSLFDHGVIRLGSRITLREHFRCMPEIIRFSNDLCYTGALVPLRQYPPKRLAPFVARRVPDGRREGGPTSAKNQAEADAIVDAIAACCADPMYKDKTMGVISLLGEHQAKLIERLLLKRIGAEEIDRRRIVCGDAYSFQGDERHVIFLSLVVAVKDDETRGFSALTKVSDMQRFNVAVSRAQDQLWLFHSVMPEDVGNRECMRHRLLTYFYDPARHAAGSIGVDLADLRQQTANPDRPEMAPSPFDSWFEVDVYLRIADRGFRVIPQYKAGRKRIDLVVEGRSRLAIECDGDRFHTDENFDDDMSRQRQLERANWRFWRVRGSEFYRDPDVALAPLWVRLTELGIEPMPATDGSGSGDGYIPYIPDRETPERDSGHASTTM
jgi:very-short-patch-repair endonuclease